MYRDEAPYLCAIFFYGLQLCSYGTVYFPALLSRTPADYLRVTADEHMTTETSVWLLPIGFVII